MSGFVHDYYISPEMESAGRHADFKFRWHRLLANFPCLVPDNELEFYA